MEVLVPLVTVMRLIPLARTRDVIPILPESLVEPTVTQFYGYGKMSAANQTTVDQNTLFGIGSITKSFTTLLLADMANRGLVNLNDPIEKYLPASVKVPTYNGQHITLESLATHTSGLPDNPPKK